MCTTYLEGMIEAHPVANFMSESATSVVRRWSVLRHCGVQENYAIHVRFRLVVKRERCIAKQSLSRAFLEPADTGKPRNSVNIISLNTR